MMFYQRVMESMRVSTYILVTILLTACSTNTAQHSRNSAMMMAHQTTILNHQTHRIIDADTQKSSYVNFEYEEIVKK